MKFTPEQIKTIKNHMPSVEKQVRAFLTVFDIPVADEVEKLEYLITLIDTMEAGLAEVKNIINGEIP